MVGRLVVGRPVVGRLVVGRLVVGRLVLGLIVGFRVDGLGLGVGAGVGAGQYGRLPTAYEPPPLVKFTGGGSGTHVSAVICQLRSLSARSRLCTGTVLSLGTGCLT